MLGAIPKEFEIGKIGRIFAFFSDLQLRLALYVITHTRTWFPGNDLFDLKPGMWLRDH
jgi:hypothetical protein